MRCLGRWLEDNGSIKTCFEKAERSMWRSFFGNLSRGLLASPESTKMRFPLSSIASIGSFRWPRWPYQQSYADRLDTIQRKMVGILMKVRPSAGETVESYRRRRRKLTNGSATKVGLWSHLWAKSMRTWHSHVQRGHDARAWSGPLLRFRPLGWLNLQRLTASKANESRTRTRAYRGYVHRRWCEGLEAAQQVAP